MWKRHAGEIDEEAVESDRAEGIAARADKNVLAFVDPHREIEVLPEGLQTGHVKRRKRGARSDRDCVEEICEIISAGITAKAACEYVGVPWATWQCWRRNNVENARERSDLAYEWDLEVIADATLSIFDELKQERDSAVKAYHEAYEAWQTWKPLEHQKERPPAPSYRALPSLTFASPSYV